MIEEQVCQDIKRRQALGLNKYGVSVADNPLKLIEWYNHLYEELLDAAIYVKRAIKQLEAENEQSKKSCCGSCSGCCKSV